MDADARVAEEAVEWLIRLEEDDSQECRSAFFDWLKQSAWHVREFLLVTEEWRSLDGMDAANWIDVQKLIDQSRGNVVPLEASAVPDSVKSRNHTLHSRRRWLVAAALAVLTFAASSFVWLNLTPRSYATGVGEQRSFQLSDGSVLHLDVRTRVEVRYSQDLRQLKLVEGEALFVVARDPARPFRVSAGAATIQALGTQFNVYRHGDSAAVSVLEGTVRVSSTSQPVILAAGEEANVSGNGRALKRAVPDVPKAMAWRRRQLVFRDDTLESVAEEFNRYNQVQIDVQGDTARAKQLIGVFDADDPQSLLLFLEKDPSLNVKRSKGRIVIDSAMSP